MFLSKQIITGHDRMKDWLHRILNCWYLIDKILNSWILNCEGVPFLLVFWESILDIWVIWGDVTLSYRKLQQSMFHYFLIDFSLTEIVSHTHGGGKEGKTFHRPSSDRHRKSEREFIYLHTVWFLRRLHKMYCKLYSIYRLLSSSPLLEHLSYLLRIVANPFPHAAALIDCLLNC